MHNHFTQQGLLVDPVPTRPGDKATICYKGILAQSGADQIYLHAGYGPQAWHDVQDLKMYRSPRGWEATVDVKHEGQFNFCFKDSANNWDNNYGLNWIYLIDR